MSIDKETEMKTGMDMAALAEQRDDERQQAEAEAAQKMLQQMQNSAKDEPAKDNAAKAQAEEDEKRRAHEEAEAKRKAEWEEKQRKRKEAEQAAWENAVAMDDDQLLKASVKRLGDDAERVTRRNMKQCVTEYIQTHCYEDMDFARQVMHPRKTMIRCFRYINRKAKEFVKQEMEDNDEKPTADGYGCDVPDDLCYQWAVQYFMDIPGQNLFIGLLWVNAHKRHSESISSVIYFIAFVFQIPFKFKISHHYLHKIRLTVG